MGCRRSWRGRGSRKVLAIFRKKCQHTHHHALQPDFLPPPSLSTIDILPNLTSPTVRHHDIQPYSPLSRSRCCVLRCALLLLLRFCPALVRPRLLVCPVSNRLTKGIHGRGRLVRAALEKPIVHRRAPKTRSPSSCSGPPIPPPMPVASGTCNDMTAISEQWKHCSGPIRAGTPTLNSRDHPIEYILLHGGEGTEQTREGGWSLEHRAKAW
ncbi:hypothetical protein B0J14DRAFT_61034 [Halenospora varia]|nr:hypothetical protein B0J14DRAFT_61034 [Halenospora varia]